MWPLGRGCPVYGPKNWLGDFYKATPWSTCFALSRSLKYLPRPHPKKITALTALANSFSWKTSFERLYMAVV